MPSTPGMKGEGYYDRHSGAQRAANKIVESWLVDAAASIALPAPPQPVVILDLGSSEGRNAIDGMRVVAEVLRQRTEQPIQTVYSDLASNNFNRLFANLESAAPFPPNVFASAAAGTFYGVVMPPRTVHLATSFNSILWLDRLPSVPVPDFVAYRRPHPPRPGLNTTAEQHAAFTSQARHDTIHFLQARASELVPGGKLVLATPGDDARGRCCDGLYDSMNDACLDLVKAGRVPRERYERLVIPVYFRTMEEVVGPLEAKDSPLCGAFSVDRLETLQSVTPFEAEFDRTGNAEAFADGFAGFLRAFSEPVVRAALVEPGEDGSVVDELFARLHQRLVAEPARYRFHYVLVAACLTRR
jgi:hypothetical protein